MRRKTLLMCTLGWFALFGATGATWAATSVLAGTFDGSEPTIAPPADSECFRTTVPYRVVEFSVTQAGDYRFYDAFYHLATPNVAHVLAEVYEGGFEPQNPGGSAPLSSPDFFEGAQKANLQANQTYTLVVPQPCDWREGPWAVGVIGPGPVASPAAAEVPQFTSGVLDTNAPRMDKQCGDGMLQARYSQSPPTRVSQSGTYYFSNSVFETGVVCLNVYTAPVNPSLPGQNLLASLDFGGSVELVADTDYYFVVQRVNGNTAGDYQFVLAPPAAFRINPGMTDSWYDPETPGQGFFVDVLDAHNAVFLGWFTYAVDPSPDDVARQRWMTAFGPFSGRQADLSLNWTTRDLISSDAASSPQHYQYVDGTVTLEFFDCASGQVSYAWGSDSLGRPTITGVIPIRRIADDSLQLCETLSEGPGVPGRL
jgi:hypothetical protein